MRVGGKLKSTVFERRNGGMGNCSWCEKKLTYVRGPIGLPIYLTFRIRDGSKNEERIQKKRRAWHQPMFLTFARWRP